MAATTTMDAIVPLALYAGKNPDMLGGTGQHLTRPTWLRKLARLRVGRDGIKRGVRASNHRLVWKDAFIRARVAPVPHVLPQWPLRIATRLLIRRKDGHDYDWR